MRTLMNFEKSTGMSETIIDFIKYKLWSPNHIEFEVQVDKFRRYPVLHMTSLPDKKVVVGGSFEKHLDFILDMSFNKFNSLGMYPITKKLLKNHFVGNRSDAFLSRAIEQHSREVHWFICAEVNSHQQINFENDYNLSFMEKNDRLVDCLTGIIDLTDKIVDDLNPSTWKVMIRGFLDGNIMGVEKFFDSFSTAPKWLEFLKDLGDWNEKIGEYNDRFCVDELFDKFST